MNRQDKLFVGLLLAFFGLVLGTTSLHASVVARAPKHVFTSTFTNVVSSVTAFTTLQATSTLEAEPGAVYQITLGTAAAGDYLVLYDTIPFNTGFLNPAVSVANQLGPRIYFGSTTQTTNIVFDPPLYFYNGLMVIMSSSADQIGITYEVGRGLTGQ